MFQILASAAITCTNTAVTALTQPATVADNDSVYLMITNGSADTAVLSAATEATPANSGFQAATTESWLFGPVRGSKIADHGISLLLNVGADTGVKLSFVKCDDLVEFNSTYRSVDQMPKAKSSLRDLTWRQLL